MKTVLYISHALKDKEEAQKARSAFASKDVFVACSGDFDASARAPGAAVQPDPNARFPDQASALDDTELFIVLRPLTEDSTLNLPCIELGRYLEISKRLGRVPQVVFFHHPNVCVPDDL